MYRVNPLLESDFYKQVHWNQYPKNVAKIVSYFTPRMTRLPEQKHLIMFGLQSFIKEFLIEDFNEFFFKRDKAEVVAECERLLNTTLGEGLCGVHRIAELHDLGYPLLRLKQSLRELVFLSAFLCLKSATPIPTLLGLPTL